MPKPSKSFIKQIQDCLDKADNIPYVNHGGCAIVAHAAYTAYKKINPRGKAKIIFLVHKFSKSDLERLNNNKHCSCNHAIVKLGNKFYDSNNVWNSLKDLHTELRHRYNAVEIDPDLCLRSIQRGSWNKAFNKRKYVPVIKSIFNIEAEYSRSKKICI